MMVQEIRCVICGKLLCKIGENPIRTIGEYVEIPKEHRIEYVQPKIEIKCPRCGEMNVRKENVKDEGSNITRDV